MSKIVKIIFIYKFPLFLPVSNWLAGIGVGAIIQACEIQRTSHNLKSISHNLPCRGENSGNAKYVPLVFSLKRPFCSVFVVVKSESSAYLHDVSLKGLKLRENPEKTGGINNYYYW